MALPQKALTMLDNLQHAHKRPAANYQQPVWTPDFVQSMKSYNTDKIHKQRAKRLKEEVKDMICDDNADPLARLELIDDIKRLGLGHHFKEDIDRELDRILPKQAAINGGQKSSLHAIALHFRLCREYGYEVSQDVFQRFKYTDDSFSKSLQDDVKGLLSLYEASYLAFEGETLLDEAKAFTSSRLKSFKGDTDAALMEQINHALELPLHHRMLRLEARWYIETYSKKKDPNHLLLELAKLDFNIVQSRQQRELQEMSRWWDDTGLAKKLSFARNRLTECFFWVVGMVSEPQLGDCRKGLTKVAALITVIDDIYDVYGSLDELQLFTNAVERWDINSIEKLPCYMKLSFLLLYNTINEMAYDTLKKQGVNIIPYLTKAWTDMCKAFMVEAKWRCNRETPTFDGYLENGWMSVSGTVGLVHAYFLVTKNITKEAIDDLEIYHNLLKCSSMIFRLCNDLGTSKDELERGESANSISCYMLEHGVCEQFARKHIRNLIDKTWNKMNKYGAADSHFGKPFIQIAMDLARIAQCTYQHGDGHGAPDAKAKKRVLSVLIEPIKLIERPKLQNMERHKP
ncbi:probable terpene synthase 12 [Diospyros lotus]|uniref:probable terpene synthase 12 n=1 Tax=Diospyros lotus TaxID=55363 RepID=UPI0022584CC7|nr:probable terpene synthase 12 [Diospyros lotus]